MRPHQRQQLSASLQDCGQLVPVVAVAGETQDGWVLIDGYRRVTVLTALKQDMVQAEIWDMDVDQALMTCLLRNDGRHWEVIEQAALIQWLSRRHSLREIGRLTGRDVSWVSRRKELLEALPEPVTTAVLSGQLSPWSANRILIPLARANSAHADQLLAQLRQTPRSTRELKQFFQHYQQATQHQRQRMVDDPDLFFRAQAHRTETTAAKALAAGPEGRWCRDLAKLRELLGQLIEQANKVLNTGLATTQRQQLTHGFDVIEERFQQLRQHIDRDKADDQ